MFAPAACPDDPLYRNADGTPKDTDGDGLWDCWEDGARWSDNLPGIDLNGGAVSDITQRDVVLCANVDTNGDGVADATECADKLVKDVFVELDFMENPDGSKSHRPDPLALLAVRTAFAKAPVDNAAGASQPTGIRLHVQVDDVVPHNDLLALEPCTIAATGGAVDFDADIKATFFGTATERQSGNPKALLAKSFVTNMDLIRRQHLLLVNMLQPPGVTPVFTNPNIGSVDELYQHLGGHLLWHKLRELEKVLQRRASAFRC